MPQCATRRLPCETSCCYELLSRSEAHQDCSTAYLSVSCLSKMQECRGSVQLASCSRRDDLVHRTIDGSFPETLSSSAPAVNPADVITSLTMLG